MSRPLHVVHLKWCFAMGGAETLLIDIMNEQVRSARVTLVVVNALEYEPNFEALAPEVHVVRLGRRPGSRNPWPLLRLRWLLHRLRPDVLHLHNPSMIQLVRGAAPRTVLTIHNTGVDLGYPLSAVDAVYAVSESVRRDVKARAGSPVDPVVAWNGIDLSQIPTRTGFGFDETFRIVQVSRLEHRQKGQDVLLEALRIAVHERGERRLHVDFIGDGPSRAYLEDLAVSLGVAAHCTFLGTQPRERVYERLREYNLLVQPSRYEGFGLTVAEGMAARLPVLCSRCEGPLEILDGGRYGYLFPPGDAQACAEAILRIMADSREPWFAEAREAALDHVRRRFDVRAVARHYLDGYISVVAA
ncbi:MAG TPA: glycosyltransferase family 4 protein [Vicinamibacterales bacterium]